MHSGLIGGIGPAATVFYYERMLIKQINNPRYQSLRWVASRQPRFFKSAEPQQFSRQP
jgi:aspartate/glutamate racemase